MSVVVVLDALTDPARDVFLKQYHGLWRQMRDHGQTETWTDQDGQNPLEVLKPDAHYFMATGKHQLRIDAVEQLRRMQEIGYLKGWLIGSICIENDV